jgi:outer membrane protein
MKLTVFLITFLLISFGLLGQTEKGNFLIGGTASIGNSNENSSYNFATTISTQTTKTFSVSVTPNISYFVIDRLAAGVITGYSYLSEKSVQVPKPVKGHTLSVGPQVRYYFPFNNFAVFPQLSYAWGWSITDSDPYSGSTEKEKMNIQTFFGGIGLAYFVRKNIGIEAIAGYKRITTSYTNDIETKDTNSQIALNFGIQFYLDRK